MTDPTYEQEAYQFVADDGTANAGTLLGTINTGYTFRVGPAHRFRDRIEINNSNAKAATNLVIDFEYSLNSGTWTPITITSSVLRSIGSAFGTPPTDGDDTTQRIGDGTLVIDNNSWDDNGTITVPAFGKSENIEAELCAFIVASDVEDGDTIEVRAVSNTGWTVTYLNTPIITVQKIRSYITHVH